MHVTSRHNPELNCFYGNVMYIRKSIHIAETGALFTDPVADNNYGLVTYAKLKIDGRLVSLCAVHGIPLPGHKLDTDDRIYQSNKIIETFAGETDVIIGGDFNLMPDTESVKLFERAGYQNLINEYEIPSTRNYITYEKYPDSIQYFADYAFVSGSIAVSNFVVPTEVVSDHQPLELEVDLLKVEQVA